MVVFRTYEFPVRLTEDQREQLTRILNRQDANISMLSRKVESMIGEGRTLPAIEQQLTARYRGSVTSGTEMERDVKSILNSARRYLLGYITKMPKRFYFECRRSVEFRDVIVKEPQVKLPELGWVEMIMHRELPEHAHIYAATMIEDYYRAKYSISLHLVFEKFDVSSLPVQEKRVLGLDYKQDGLYVDSNGQSGEYPGFLRKNKEKLADLRQCVKRFSVGSTRWLKIQKRIVRLQRHIMNQRKDWQFKRAKILATENDAICLEQLDFRKMKKDNPALINKIQDNYWPGFLQKLRMNLAMQGKPMIEIAKYFPSSQICSVCGFRLGKVPLSQRRITCECCASTIDRDINAARNIRDEGLRMLKAS